MPSPSSPVRQFRVLVIGAGAMAVHTHLPLLARLRDEGLVVLSVVCDIQRERAADAKKRFGFAKETGDAIAALARADVDAVYIFGSAQMHCEYGLLALDGGKHLFVEKPIAPSFFAARQLAEKARERNLVAVGGHNRRFFPSFAKAQSDIGRTGWRFIEAVFHKPEFSKPAPYGVHSWLTANGIHALDAIIFMAGGLPSQISSIAEAVVTQEPRNFSAIMRWHDGCQAVFACDNSAGSRKEEYVFHGVERTCTIIDSQLKVETPAGASQTVFSDDALGFAGEHREFLAAMRGELKPRHDLASLAPSLYVAELIERGYTGTVSLPDRADGQHPEVAQPAIRVLRPTGRSILVIAPGKLQNVLPLIAADHRVVSLDDIRSKPGPAPEIVAAIVGHGGGALPEDILARLPGLAVVGIAGLSLRHYGPEALFARGVSIVNASEAYAKTVAELVLGLALLGRRRAFLSHEVMRKGGWGTTPHLPGFRGLVARTARAGRTIAGPTPFGPYLKRAWGRARTRLQLPEAAPVLRGFSGVTVGIVGWSANARAFVELLRPFGAHVKVFSEHASAEEVLSAGAVKGSLGEVLKAEIVSLHRSLNEKTRHSLGAAELELLRPGAVLINTARGGLIDEKALVARLRRGDVSACLDTYESEPLPRSHPLRKMSNVFLTAHIAGGTSDMHAAAAHDVVAKVLDYLSGKDVKTVSREQWEMMS